jgi:hypothetical protein
LFGAIDIPPGQESLGWDGKFNGEDMQPGVFVYTAELLYEDV